LGDFFGVGRIYSGKYRPNVLGAILFENIDQIDLKSSRFLLVFVIKFPNFDQMCISLATVLI
jgi:hypothetical protein